MPESTSPEPRYDDPKSSSTAWVAAIGGLILLVLIMGLQLVFRQMEDTEIEAKQSSADAEALAALEATQEAEISDFAWVDRAQGVVRMPIATAMEEIVDRYGKVAGR